MAETDEKEPQPTASIKDLTDPQDSHDRPTGVYGPDLSPQHTPDVEPRTSQEASQVDADLHEQATQPGTDMAYVRGELVAKEPQKDGIYVNFFGCTDVGLVREHNEDNLLLADLSDAKKSLPEVSTELKVGPKGVVLAVCDGMGGAAAGEIASQMAVDTLFEKMSGDDSATDRDVFAKRLVSAVLTAGERIFKGARDDRTRQGMGTTATVAGLIDKVLFVGQVGDSRAYLFRQGQLTLITKDQSLVNQLLEAGQLTQEEADAFEHSNIILQALGTTEQVLVDLTFLELRKGDRLLLCSDGLSGLVHADVMREVLSRNPSLADCAHKLRDMAKAGGGHDNITVVVADFTGQDLQEPDEKAIVGYQQYPLPMGDDGISSLGDMQRSSRKSRSSRPQGEFAAEADALLEGNLETRQVRTAARMVTVVAWLGVGIASLIVIAAWMMNYDAETSEPGSNYTTSSTPRALSPEPNPTATLPEAEPPTEAAVPHELHSPVQAAAPVSESAKFAVMPSKPIEPISKTKIVESAKPSVTQEAKSAGVATQPVAERKKEPSPVRNRRSPIEAWVGEAPLAVASDAGVAQIVPEASPVAASPTADASFVAAPKDAGAPKDASAPKDAGPAVFEKF